MKNQILWEKAREQIIENRQKGELYRIELKDDPQVYEGIPVDFMGMVSDKEECFELKVLEPASARGMRVIPYRRITAMKPLL
jgi:hypothetical protein